MSHGNQNHRQAIPPCAAELTTDDLSAWRDETLPADEADRIAAHSADCPACLRRLRGFETVAAALRTQRIPSPDERLWREVRAAILASKPSTGNSDITHETTIPDQSGAAPIPHVTARAHSRRRRALGTLAAVAAIALVVVGFGRLLQFGASNRPAAETFQLHWKQVTLPGAISKTPGAEATLSVFPANGAVAWLCQSGTKPAPGPLNIWRTTDSGMTWTAIRSPTVAKSISCQMTLDQLDPNVALLRYGFIDTTTAPGTTLGANFTTYDGGTTWLSDQEFNLVPREIATVSGGTNNIVRQYALRQLSDDSYRLEVSAASGVTILDDAIHNQKLLSDYFWVNPTTGGLLLEAHSLVSPKDGYSFWSADANGSNWRKVGESPEGSVAAMPTSDGRWSICTLVAGVSTDVEQPDFRSYVYCGTDTGAWSKRSGPDIPRTGEIGATPSACASCGQAGASIPYGAVTFVGMANDGAVLAMVDDRFDAKGETTHTGIYRLPAGSSRWQSGGGLPGDMTAGDTYVTYTPRPNGGILWSMPIPALDGHLADTVYTASYPGVSTQPLPTQFTKALPTPTPTGNIDQGAPLEWQPINQPSGFQPKLTSSNVLTVAPSDGQTAYACAQPNTTGTATQLRGWVTHDAGATWTKLALPQLSGWCALVVDEVNPRDVLLGFSHNPPAGGPITPELYYHSADGGASWRHIPGLDGSVIYQFASYHSAIYALRDATPGSVGDFAHVQVSTDGMANWRTIDGGFFSSNIGAAQFRLNPYNGALLATNAPTLVNGIPATTVTSALVWASHDGGAHWRSLQAPQTSGDTNILIQPPQPNHAWGVCAASVLLRPATAPSFELICGDDSGQVARPMPLLDSGDPTAMPSYTAYTSDGAILAVMKTTSGSGAISYNVYRLPAGASRWQSIGATPEFSLLYAPASDGSGILWSVPVNGIATDSQGRVFRVAAP
jgi:hypothetical protein